MLLTDVCLYHYQIIVILSENQREGFIENSEQDNDTCTMSDEISVQSTVLKNEDAENMRYLLLKS